MVFYKGSYLRNFHRLTDYLITKGISMSKVKFSHGSDGEVWSELDVEENKIKNRYLEGNYTEFELSGSKLNDMTINIQKETGYVGFVISLKWTEVVSHEVIHLQQGIIRCLVDLYHTLMFEYAFIGHEIEVEIHPDKFEKCLQKQHAFPVALIGKGDHIDIYYGDVAMDGLSSQERRMECVKVER
ncbi:Imm64 family immunity protein [Bacillus pumilus]|uniref:Imm64 family immunity protein n=1 Tax=Bacillus pumilus TaxID=1408 RepID=UPI00265E2B67|nr:Imm64 family immunity protein [Bacillus pumilus]